MEEVSSKPEKEVNSGTELQDSVLLTFVGVIMHIDKQSQIIVGKMQNVISDLVRENYELMERLELASKEKQELKDALEIQIGEYLQLQESLEANSYF
jgi:hypothetical protein